MFPERENDVPVATPSSTGSASPIGVLQSILQRITAPRGIGAQYAQLLQLMPVAICVCDAEGRITLYNQRAVDLWRWSNGQPAADGTAEWFAVVDTNSRGIVPSPLEAALKLGLSCRDIELVLARQDGSQFDACVTIDAWRDAVGRMAGAIVVTVDITERRKRERHAALIADLTEQLTTAVTETDIVRVTGRLVGQHLRVQRCGFVENERGTGMLRVIAGWLRDPLPTLAGRYELDALGDAEWQRKLGSARIAIDDVTTDPHTRAYADNYRTRGVRAYAGAPFVREGKWVATLTVTSEEPRAWTADEVGLLEEIVARVWPLIERARSQAVLELISTNAPVVLSGLDRESRVIYANRAFAARWSVDPPALIGKHLAEIIGTEAFVVAQPYIERVLAGESVQFEVDLPYRQLGPRYVRVSCVPDRDAGGQVRGYLSAVSDLTERRDMERAVLASEERFRTLAQNAPVGIFMTDPNGDTIFVNASWCAIAGLSLDQARGGGWAGAIHPDDRDRVLEAWQIAVRQGISSKAEFRFLRSDGTITWVHGTAVQIRDAAGRLTGYIGTIADFTERKQAELALRESEERYRSLTDELRGAQQQLRAHADDLERKVEARTASLREAIVQMEEFSYSVSHDLRAPLRAMNAYAMALTEDYGDRLDETGRDYLWRIQRSSQRMEKLTYDVLNYSRVARTEIVMVDVDLKPVLRDIVGQYAELQPQSADLIVEQPLHHVLAHELSLGQCLGNLLTNAAKFVAPGVRPRIRVLTADRGAFVRVSVVDNGIGIVPEHQANLFHMFERVPTAVPYEGTGIGLAIVRKAVEKMGGRYGVESDGVNGSCFWIELPKS